jgi:hypothetical protein
VNVTWSWRRFWYGTAGAAAPEVVRLFKLLKEQHAAFTFHDLTLGMVLISLAFVTLGGVFASAWGDDHPIKCMYNGATFPVLLNAWYSSAPPSLPK